MVDKLTGSGPAAINGQLVRAGLKSQAEKEPHRYDAVRAAGFLAVDVEGDLSVNLYERGGGHYVDMGAMELIAKKEVGVRSGVFPVAYTEKGMTLSDGSEVEADAIVWCTGFADRNVKTAAPSVFGKGGEEIAERMDGTMGLDAEGEVRGIWKRQRDVDNFWVFGGTTIHHRYCSKFVALQLKASVEGFLPPAYLETITK
jgi:hypothetical protein